MAKGIYSGLAGGITFILFLLGLDMSILMAATSSVAVYFATYLLLPKPSTEISIKQLESDFYQNTIDQAKQKVALIEGYQIQIQNQEIQAKVKLICQLSGQIIENIEKNPQEIQVIRSFFTYYLDATMNIIRKYVEISNQKTTAGDIQQTLKKTEELLDLIISLYRYNIVKLLEDDVLELDTEMETFKKIIESEGEWR